MKTLEVRTNGIDLNEGWQIVTISYAADGEWNGIKYIDVWFDELPESMNLRIYETYNTETEQEFAIGNLYRFADAGLGEVKPNGNGSKLVSINDNPDVMKGKKLNIFLYRDGGGYFRILPRVAPAEPFENHLERMTADSIEYWKDRAEYYYDHFVVIDPDPEPKSTPF